MRVIVVGAAGNLGTALLDELAADHEIELVMAVARRPPGRSWPKTVFHAFDVPIDDLTAHLAGAEAVVHLAWWFHPTYRPQVTWETNVGGSQRIFRACAAPGVCALVHASSIGACSPAPGSVAAGSEQRRLFAGPLGLPEGAGGVTAPLAPDGLALWLQEVAAGVGGGP